jgi:D-arabinose 1-dehydrogenase-like Zn-dependent alcohol dehydrogenase
LRTLLSGCILGISGHSQEDHAMKALVYEGPGSKTWKDVPDPTVRDDTDAIVRVDATTICGSDLHS